MMWTGLPMLERTCDPFRDFRSLERQAAHLFDAYRWRTAEFPGLNVRTNEDEAVVTAELPGLGPKDVEITVVGDTLTLKGERQTEELSEDEVYHRRERDHGRFVRSIRLPFQVEAGKVRATTKNGVLEVTLPRHEASKPKTIKILTR